MGILKELLEIAEKEGQPLTEARRPKKQQGAKVKGMKPPKRAKTPGKPHDKHSDGTNKQFKKDRPYTKDPKYPQYIPGNMWFNMTKSGSRAGELE